MRKQLHFGLGLPMRSTVSTISGSALIAASSMAAEWCVKEGHEYSLCTVSRAHTCGARMKIANAAIGDEVDWLLWLDDDAFPPPDILQRLYERAVEHQADAVAALCFERGGEMRSPAGRFDERNQFQRVYESGWIDSTGMHAILMRAELLRRVRAKLGGQPMFQAPLGRSTNGEPEFVGEDRYFWGMARTCSPGLRLWHAADVEVGHVFEMTLNSATRPALLKVQGME